jgi:dipeptidyl aminopeptidase/acylaminoacyl peptidase
MASGRTHVLDNDARTYSRITWNDSGTGVAVLKGKDVPRMRDKENVLAVFPSVRSAFAGNARAAAIRLDTMTAGFPRGFVVSDRAVLDWSDDSRRVFFGIMPQRTAADTGRRRSTDSVPDVDIWRTTDERIQSVQMIRAEADRNFTFRQALDLSSGRFIKLADSSMRDLDVSPDGRWAIGRDPRPYVADYGRAHADIYRVNPATGERSLVVKNQLIQQWLLGFSTDSKHWLYWRDGRIQSYDLDAGTTRALGAGAPSFVDMEFDYPGPKPSYGIAGFTADGRGVVAHHRYDLWLLPFDGGAARTLTGGEGSRNEIEFRVVRTVPPDPMAPRVQREGRVIDLSRPVTLSAYGEWTKKSGFYTLSSGKLQPVVYEDASFSTPMRALRADRYLFTRQSFVEFPDLRVSGPAFAQARRISDANPQQKEFAWGRRLLFEYTLKDGKRAQGILAIPDDYREGEKRPMLVNFYEKNSQNMHRHSPPSFIGSLNANPIEAVSKGYLFMLPDVYFRTGQSHSDMLEAVEAATKKVIEMGYADPARIGLHGHSYSGEGAAFIATQSKLFAAVAIGAGVTDLTSDFSQSWGWAYQVNSGSGQNAFEYYLYTQGRWGFSPWDKPEVYRFESALTHVPAVQVPILIMHGTADPTVAFSEGMNFYSALRYNKKTAYMIAYPNEGHGLRGVANRKDFTIRYFHFFDHYLRGAPPAKWMIDGVPFLMKDSVTEPK